MIHLHRIRLDHIRGIAAPVEWFFSPGARVMYCSDGPGATKSSIHDGIELAMTGRCDGTDAAGKGAKGLVNEGGTKLRVLVGIGNGERTVGFDREIPIIGKVRTRIWDGNGTPDTSAPIADVVEAEVGVGEEALLPLHRPLAFLAMSEKDRRGVLLAACGRWSWESLAEKAGRSVDELIALDGKLDGQPLRRAAKRMVALVNKERLAADKAATAAGGRITELVVQAEKETVEPPSDKELAAAEKAMDKAEKAYQKLTARVSKHDEAQARVQTALGKAKKAREAGGTGPAFTALHEANERVEAARRGLVKLNKVRARASLEPVSLEAPPAAPSNMAKMIWCAENGCPVGRQLEQYSDHKCGFIERDEALVAQLQEQAGDTETAYAAAMMKLDELTAAQEAAAAANAIIADAGTEARGLEQAEAELRAAQEAYKAAKPVEQAAVDKAKLKARLAQDLFIALKAREQAANTGAAERLADAKRLQSAANEESARWQAWEKLLALDGGLIGSWVAEVGQRYDAELPRALKALSGGKLELTDPDGPVVNGRLWTQLSRGEKKTLALAVGGAWGGAIGVKLLNVDDVDCTGEDLPRILQVLGGNGNPQGTVLLYAVGTEARRMAEEAGWEVVRL